MGGSLVQIRFRTLSEASLRDSCCLSGVRRALVGPAAPPSRVPTKSWSADHSDRRSDNDRTGRLNHDYASVEVTTTIRAAVCAASATFRGLSTEACEAQQGGESRYRQDLPGHLLGYPCFRVITRLWVTPYAHPMCVFLDELHMNESARSASRVKRSTRKMSSRTIRA